MGKKKGDDPKPKKSGCLRMIMFLVILIVMGLGAAVYFTFEPQDLTDIEGYQAEPTAAPSLVTGRDIGAVR